MGQAEPVDGGMDDVRFNSIAVIGNGDNGTMEMECCVQWNPVNA